MLAPSEQETETLSQIPALSHHATQASILAYSPSTQELQAFCKCEHPHLGNRLAFELGLVHHFLEKHVGHFALLYKLIALSLLSFLLFQIIYLIVLFQSSSFSGKSYKGIPIFVSNKIHSPASWGLLGKRIFWPAHQFNSPGSEHEKDSILEHEYSHIRQNHSLELLCFRFTGIFFWFNPSIFLIRRELRLIGECIADADGVYVMQDRKGYAKLLLDLASVQQRSRILNSFFQHPLSYRISYVLGRHQKSQKKSARFIWYLLPGIILQLVGNYYFLAPGVDQFVADHQLYVSMQEKLSSSDASLYSCQDCKGIYIE